MNPADHNQSFPQDPGGNANNSTAATGGELSLLDLMVVFAKHKKAIILFPLVLGILTAIYSLLITPTYTGTSRILPPQQSQSTAAALLGQLSGAAAGALNIKQPNDLYISMLKSRTVADRLIERFKLQEVFQSQYLQDARQALAGSTNISGKDTIITIEYSDSDPKRAAAIANAYVEELHHLTQNLAVTEASQRRLFFERQVKQAKDELATAEVELKRTQESTGVFKLDEQGRVIIEGIAQLRAQIIAKEVQLASMRTFASERNPDYLRIGEELAGLRSELAKAEKGSSVRDGNIFVPTGKVPETSLEYARKLRDVKYHEILFELLAKQYELSKIDEAKDATLVQVLDVAVVPERRTSPRRRLMVTVAVVLGAIIAVMWALCYEVVERSRTNPQQRDRWARFGKLIWFR